MLGVLPYPVPVLIGNKALGYRYFFLKPIVESRPAALGPRPCIPGAWRPSPGQRVSGMKTLFGHSCVQPCPAPPSFLAEGRSLPALPRPASVSCPLPLRERPEVSFLLSSPCSRSPPTGRECTVPWPFRSPLSQRVPGTVRQYSQLAEQKTAAESALSTATCRRE